MAVGTSSILLRKIEMVKDAVVDNKFREGLYLFGGAMVTGALSGVELLM